MINTLIQFILIGGYTAFRHFGVRGVDYVSNKCIINPQFVWFSKNLDGPIGKRMSPWFGNESRMKKPHNTTNKSLYMLKQFFKLSRLGSTYVYFVPVFLQFFINLAILHKIMFGKVLLMQDKAKRVID